MVKLDFKKAKRALVIVAHPDDESIWMGGFILKHPELRWTILSLCRASDPDRAPKFKKVCKYLKARPIMEDLDDDGNLTFEQSLPIIKKLILKNIKNKKITFLFTHGENGEYGHEAHRAVHQVIKELASQKKLPVAEIFYFNYKKSNQKNKPLIARANSDLLLNLSPTEFLRKKNILTAIYGFSPEGIDANYCTNPEAFEIVAKL